MAKPLSNLTEETAPVGTDLLYLVRPGGPADENKVQITNLPTGIRSVTRTVAANNASQKVKDAADFVCTGLILLDYDTGTGGVPVVGDTLTGGTSGTTATIDVVSGDATSGTLTISAIAVSKFQNNEVITAPTNAFSALANGVIKADEVQIQAAVDELPVAGGEVRTSEGQFEIATSVKLGNFHALSGQGEGISILKLVTNVNEPVIINDNQAGTNNDIIVRDLTVDANLANQVTTGPDYSVMWFKNAIRTKIINVESLGGLRDTTFTFGEGIRLERSDFSEVQGGYWHDNEYDGIKIWESDHCLISNVRGKDNQRAMVQIFGTLGKPSLYNSINGVTYTSDGVNNPNGGRAAGIALHTARQSVITNLALVGPNAGFDLVETAVGNTFSNFYIATRSSVNAGIYIEQSAVSGEDRNVFSNGTIEGFSGAAGNLILIQTDSDFNTIQNCTIRRGTGTGVWKIQMNAGSTENEISNCRVDANAFVSVTINGTDNFFHNNHGNVDVGPQFLNFADGGFSVRPTKKMYVDGAVTKQTYFWEESDDDAEIVVGTEIGLKLEEIGTEVNVVPGAQNVIAIAATDGYFYVPYATAGPQTGTPKAYTGKSAVVYDQTNNKLQVYDVGDGAWKTFGGTLTLDFKATPSVPEGTTAFPDTKSYATFGGSINGHVFPDGVTEDTVTYKVNVPSTLASTPNAKIVLRIATINATATNETRWEVKSLARSDGESLDTAPTTDTAGTDLTMSASASIEEELVINMNTPPTAGDHLFILAKRKSNHANDNYADQVFLTDVSLRIDVR